MRRAIVVLLLAVLTPFFAPPFAARAEQTTLFGQSVDTEMDQWRAEAVNGQLSAVISKVEDFVRRYPDSRGPARLLGDLYFRKPDFPAAERTYKRILSRYPEDSETWNRLGGLYAAEDRINDAISAFNKSVLDPSEYPSLVALHQRRGDLADFERSVATDVQNEPANEEKILDYAMVLRALGKHDEALTFFKQALSLSTPAGRCPALSDLALAYLDVHRISEAVPLLQTCLSINPKEYGALVNLGEANIELGRFNDARDLLDRAVKVKIDRPEAYVDIGFIEDSSQNWKSAINNYEKAITVDPLWRDAYIDLGYDYYSQKMYSLAEAAFIKGLSVSPRDGHLSYLLGVTYRDQGKVALAKQQYEHAVNYGNEENVILAARRDLSALEAEPPNTAH
ncbi:MAG: tetratricopeptide repeat protein [Vulcanimicrobiaceae bacterium]|jgi:tetratricopeptide (TPR) repeat protein